MSFEWPYSPKWDCVLYFCLVPVVHACNERIFFGFYSEKAFFKNKFRREKLYRKHFKDLQPQEVSLLTYAEKENIRYLHESNPDHWTPEKLAESFPISAEGAAKLLKSGFRAHRPEDVIRHDEKVKDRLERVKAGEITLTPELKRKMAIREKIQFKVGELPESVKELAIPVKPKPLGEFARLVASPEKIRQNEEQIALAEKEEQEAARRSEQFVQQMKEREIYAGSRFTLAEFEEKIKLEAPKDNSSVSSTTVSPESNDLVPEVQYLLDMKAKKKVKPTEVSEMLRESEETAFIGHRVQKFKSKNIDEDDLVPVNVEGGVPYLYDSKSGYQVLDQSLKVNHLMNLPCTATQ